MSSHQGFKQFVHASSQKNKYKLAIPANHIGNRILVKTISGQCHQSGKPEVDRAEQTQDEHRLEVSAGREVSVFTQFLVSCRPTINRAQSAETAKDLGPVRLVIYRCSYCFSPCQTWSRSDRARIRLACPAACRMPAALNISDRALLARCFNTLV